MLWPDVAPRTQNFIFLFFAQRAPRADWERSGTSPLPPLWACRLQEGLETIHFLGMQRKGEISTKEQISFSLGMATGAS